MVEIRLHTVIDKDEINRWFAMWGEDDVVFSLDSWQRILDAHPDEKDFRFNIHCDGGSVDEGLAIYDALRTSGKNIYMNIEGGCHSMAVVMLLAAPIENRSANPNCRALIHKVWTGVCGGYTADELEALAADCRQAEDSILDIYADRTKKTREELVDIMNEQKERTAQELLDWGFISKINSYTNNSKQKGKMKKNAMTASQILNKINTLLKGGPKNYEFTDPEGTVLFTTTAETDELEVGMEATPDGTFTLEDGRVVTIEAGVITKIEEPENNPEDDPDNKKKKPCNEGEDPEEGSEDDPEKLKEENDALKKENENLKKQLDEANARIAELEKSSEETETNLKNALKDARSFIQSNYNPAPRQNNGKQAPQEKSYETLKEEAAQKRNLMRK